MRVLKVTIQNVKRLVGTLEIIPTTDVVSIVGKNDQGKTTLLQSLRWVFEGAAIIQEEPISRGQERALIRLELGDGREVELIAELRLTKKGGRELSFRNADKSPQKLTAQQMANSLRGAISFDPLAFDRMKPREQYDLLRKVANLSVDIEELDRQNAADYSRRTEINRDAKQKRAAAAQLPIVKAADPIPTEPIMEEIRGASTFNERINEKKKWRENRAAEADKLEADAKAHRVEAQRLILLADDEDATATEIRAKLAEAVPLAPLVDVAVLTEKLNAAIKQNSESAAWAMSERRRKSLIDEAEHFESESETLTVAMEAREIAKRQAIESAELPVEGLGFGDGIVTFDGLPFAQAGTAKRTEVCCGIAMAMNPKLKVICIEDASLLDKESRAIVERMAEEHGYQYFLELVADTDDPEFVIEEGMVAISDGKVMTKKRKEPK
jgi:predicted ATP-dependent endonuclease of OLD family